jgi:hypothetical protein
MIIKVNRHAPGEDSTGGNIDINDYHFGYSVEDEHREVKVMHETCIGAGRYQILLRDEGGMNKRYHEKFPGMHRGMLHLQDVPKFEWIYMHPGITDDHTSGCILVGYGIQTINGESEIVRGTSTPAYVALYNLVLLAMDRGEEVWVEVI